MARLKKLGSLQPLLQRVVPFLFALLATLLTAGPAFRRRLVKSLGNQLGDVYDNLFDWRSQTSKLEDVIEHDGMRVVVVSHGGVGTTAFVDYLQKTGVNRPGWSRNYFNVVHMPKPVTLVDPYITGRLKTIVYIFGDPLVSLCSVKRRNFGARNLKRLGRGTGLWWWLHSDHRLLEAMYLQFKAWTNPATRSKLGYSVLSLSHEDVFDPLCLSTLCSTLGTCKTAYDPLRQQQRETAAESQCVVGLEKGLWARQREKVREMRAFAETTICARLRRQHRD
jgi:hypothetical protein